jgi:hypothetical protein
MVLAPAFLETGELRNKAEAEKANRLNMVENVNWSQRQGQSSAWCF